MSELEDEAYFDSADPELNDVSAAALDATVATLSPAEPLCLRATATVHEAVQAMLARRQAGVLIVDGEVSVLQADFVEVLAVQSGQAQAVEPIEPRQQSADRIALVGQRPRLTARRR